MQLKRAWQSSACSRRCAIGAARRWSKPVALAMVVAASSLSLFSSCKKFDPRDYTRVQAPKDSTIAWAPLANKLPVAGTIMKDTLRADTLKKDTLVLPLKKVPIVASRGNGGF